MSSENMKNIYLIILFLFTVFVLKAQIGVFDYEFDTKIIYNYNYQFDSTSVESRMEVLTQLSIGDHISHFQTVRKFESDSALSLNQANNMIFYAYGRIDANKFMIVKKDDAITTFEPISGVGFSGNNQLSYYDEKVSDLDWEIHLDTALINEFLCQKATLKWGGRKWIAWFTMDIPISDGPYKFCGLPGLIVSISDQDNYFMFDLVAIEKVRHSPINFDKLRTDFILQKTTKEEFYKERKSLSRNMVEFAEATGTKLSQEKKRLVNIEIKEDNNHIERY